jgi:hypothetical protein
MSTWPQFLGENKRLFDGGIGATTNFLEVYIGEVVWPLDPLEAKHHGLHGHWSNVGARYLIWFRLL